MDLFQQTGRFFSDTVIRAAMGWLLALLNVTAWCEDREHIILMYTF